MPSHRPHRHEPLGGRHENGQNLLVDPRTIGAIVSEVASWPPGPVTEFAAGAGALTRPLARAGRPVAAVEIDPVLAASLRRRVGPGVPVAVDDMLRHPLPRSGGVLCNVPFHLTTPWLRRLLDGDGWERALLLLQWEVARKRAGVGGATLLTARWWPWYDFALLRRVPATAFRPRPSVDGGLLLVSRPGSPAVAAPARRAYQSFVARVFTGPGRGIGQTVARTEGLRGVAAWMRAAGIDPRQRPRDMRAAEWVALFEWASARPSRRRARALH